MQPQSVASVSCHTRLFWWLSLLIWVCWFPIWPDRGFLEIRVDYKYPLQPLDFVAVLNRPNVSRELDHTTSSTTTTPIPRTSLKPLSFSFEASLNTSRSTRLDTS
ncbi:hypothetical protein F4802DRAFT_564196 [Xylaria palmicola]|nr:hypothetical protein F4802DRAFT_564196 [Xylaria palmicola]